MFSAASKPAFQLAQLVIHMDAQRLEGAGGGMDGMAQGGGALRFRHDLGQLRRAGDGARGDDGAGDAAGVLFLAIARDGQAQGALVGAVDEIGGAFARQAHAHVQRAVLAEGKTPRRLVELEGRNAQIQHDAVAFLGELVHVGEFALHQGQPAAEPFHQRLAAGDGVGIAVDAQHAAIGGFQDGALA